MDALTTDQNFRLNNAVDWIDTFAEEFLDDEDSSSVDALLTADAQGNSKDRPGAARGRRARFFKTYQSSRTPLAALCSSLWFSKQVQIRTSAAVAAMTASRSSERG
jgi:hypothetical protein